MNLAFVVCLGILAVGAQNGSATNCPISEHKNGWELFVDPVHRFCFEYPASYKRVQHVRKLDHFTAEGAKVIAQFESAEMRGGSGEDREHAAIILLFSEDRFHLQGLVSDAPTGVEKPPTPVHFGRFEFFKYGPGGGGVAYDDIVYLNLRGRTLRIVFDGPFDGSSKSPSEKTQQMEKEFLSSFRTF
jgi:hypothetical protein